MMIIRFIMYFSFGLFEEQGNRQRDRLSLYSQGK